jgi:transposase
VLDDEDAVLQQKRSVVERTTGWLKGFRRLRFRVDRTAASFQAVVYLAILVLCVRRLVYWMPMLRGQQLPND